MKVELKTDKLSAYVHRGWAHKNWYDQEATNLICALPEFTHLPIIRAFAVTSITTSIEANVYQAVKALIQMSKGEKFHGFLPAQITYLNLIREGKDVPGRKIMNFIRALEGDKDAVVVDIWMCRAFGIDNPRLLKKGRNYTKAPTRAEYDAVESFCRDTAKLAGIEPRQYQSVIWAGIKRDNGVTRNTTWSQLLTKKRGVFPFI